MQSLSHEAIVVLDLQPDKKASYGEGEGENGEEDYRARGEIYMPCFTCIDKEEKTTGQEENIYALFHRHR